MHIADFETNNLGANGIVGGGVPLGAGAALASKLRKDGRITGIFFSDGGANEGIFAETLNLAAIHDLPLVMVIENNQYAVSPPLEETSRSNDLYKRAEGYGVPSWHVNGNDVIAVYEKMAEAVKLINEDRGPVVLEAKTFRHAGHHVNDPGLYMPKEKLEYYRSIDPVDVLGKKYMLERFSEKDLAELEKEVDQELEDAIEFAQNSPEPDVAEFLEEVGVY
jgi:pyruvate dehydrogenase E1 component alpha subunit